MTSALAALVGLLTLLSAASAQAEALDQQAVYAEPQRYLMSLPPAPVDEIAQEVLGKTLGVPVSTDPTITAHMSFRVDGVYTPGELARELGYRLWNVDVALIDSGSDGLRLIPASAAPAALRAGAELVSPVMPPEAPARAVQTAAPMPSRTLQRSWPSTVGVFALGAVCGAGLLDVARRLRRRRHGGLTTVALLNGPASRRLQLIKDHTSYRPIRPSL